MAGFRRWVAPLALLLATACGIPGAAPDDQTLSMAGPGPAPAVRPVTTTPPLPGA